MDILKSCVERAEEHALEGAVCLGASEEALAFILRVAPGRRRPAASSTACRSRPPAARAARARRPRARAGQAPPAPAPPSDAPSPPAARPPRRGRAPPSSRASPCPRPASRPPTTSGQDCRRTTGGSSCKMAGPRRAARARGPCGRRHCRRRRADEQRHQRHQRHRPGDVIRLLFLLCREAGATPLPQRRRPPLQPLCCARVGVRGGAAALTGKPERMAPAHAPAAWSVKACRVRERALREHEWKATAARGAHGAGVRPVTRQRFAARRRLRRRYAHPEVKHKGELRGQVALRHSQYIAPTTAHATSRRFSRSTASRSGRTCDSSSWLR